MDIQELKFKKRMFFIPLYTVLVLWIVYWSNIKFGLDLNSFGVYPRTIDGLLGVLFSPFLHGSLEHLFNNSLPLLVLLTALMYFYREVAVEVVLYGVLFSGLFTWAFGRESYHIGASGFIYVLVSFIFFKGIWTKYYRLVALSLTVVVMYGGMIWYMFPQVADKISWEGHLGGFLTGLFLSVILKTTTYVQKIQYDWQRSNFNPDTDPFMRNFDADGKFNPPPKAEEQLGDYFFTSVKVVYDYIGSDSTKKDYPKR